MIIFELARRFSLQIENFFPRCCQVWDFTFEDWENIFFRRKRLIKKSTALSKNDDSLRSDKNKSVKRKQIHAWKNRFSLNWLCLCYFHTWMKALGIHGTNLSIQFSLEIFHQFSRFSQSCKMRKLLCFFFARQHESTAAAGIRLNY